uniref:S1 motif domain-containing protein n=1 Tax=Emiliania huxleyi TaxID=2903 RepID=A0A7S3TD82_EMIHU
MSARRAATVFGRGASLLSLATASHSSCPQALPMIGVPALARAQFCRTAPLLMLAASNPALPAVGSLHVGVVESVVTYGAFCSLEGQPGRDGLLHVSHIDPSGGRVEVAEDALAVGDRVRVRVTSVADGKISLSCRGVQQGGDAPAAWRLWTPSHVLGSPPTARTLEGLECVVLSYSRSSGAGGQAVNKLSTKCEARLCVAHSPWPDAVKARLLQLGGATRGGELLAVSDRHRTQAANRKDALEKLAALVADAWRPPKVRRQRSGLSERGKRQRRDEKRRTSEKKRGRSEGRRGLYEARRKVLVAAAALSLSVPRLGVPAGAAEAGAEAEAGSARQAGARREPVVPWGPFKGLEEGDIDALEAASLAPDAGYTLPCGSRVIDLVVGTGPQPRRGDVVYCQYKVWAGGFRAGPVADWTYYDGRPYGWTLGTATDREPPDAENTSLRQSAVALHSPSYSRPTATRRQVAVVPTRRTHCMRWLLPTLTLVLRSASPRRSMRRCARACERAAGGGWSSRRRTVRLGSAGSTI